MKEVCDCIWTDAVCRHGHGNRQCHRLHGQENELSFPLGGNGILGRRDALCLIRGDLRQGRGFPFGRYGDYWGHWINAASFFGGMLLIGLIDNLIPSAENPHETHSEAGDHAAAQSDRSAAGFRCGGSIAANASADGFHDHGLHHHKLMRMGLFTALAIGIHNFPEGLATFLAALQDPESRRCHRRGDRSAQHS